MDVKDLKEETELKISFPDESEIENDIQRIMLTTHSLLEYLLDLGLESGEIYKCVMCMALNRYFEDQLDLEFARQEAQNYLNESVNNTFNHRKELQESTTEHADFFSSFMDSKSPPTMQ